jgi:nitrogen fixation protein FixH
MTSPQPALDLHAPPPGAARRPSFRLPAGIWPWVPALLLVSLLGTQLVVLSSALDDPAFATEPDYYRKALDWDAQQARQRQSQALGWTAHATGAGAGHGERALSVSIADAQGAALSGAAVRAVAYSNARAARARELTFREVSPGVYRAELGAARPGIWELRLSATRGADRFEATLRVELDDAGGRP